MALDKDIVGSIEFLEVEGLQGSTYLLKRTQWGTS